MPSPLRHTFEDLFKTSGNISKWNSFGQVKIPHEQQNVDIVFHGTNNFYEESSIRRGGGNGSDGNTVFDGTDDHITDRVTVKVLNK